MEAQCVDQIAVRDDVIGIARERPAIAIDAVFEAPLVLQHVAEIVVRGRKKYPVIRK